MKILIVDDREENLYLLESLLKGSGYEATSAENGVEALEKLKKESVDIIISDILMPKMDGFALCRECKSDNTLKKIPFIFYTATYTDKKDEEFALSLGAERFIVKPTEPERFIEIIKEVLENHKKGMFPPSRIPPEKEESVYLKLYNERLVKKLEHKMLSLEGLNRELVERMKELTCLYNLSKLLIDFDRSLEDVLQGVANLIPHAWQYPGVTCGRVTFEGREFRTDNFKKTKWIQSADIKIKDSKVGVVEVCYLEEKPKVDEDPFLDQERNLISTIAEQLDLFVERKKMEEEREKHVHGLEVFHKATVNRELKMVELKKKIKELEEKLNEK